MPADLETLTYELVQQGVDTAGPQEDNLHAKIVNRVERELIAQVHDLLRQRANQGRHQAGHQPQHAAQEAQRIWAGRRVRPPPRAAVRFALSFHSRDPVGAKFNRSVSAVPRFYVQRDRQVISRISITCFAASYLVAWCWS